MADPGLALTELDSVPGGIGLTAWLNQTYTQLGAEVIGRDTGMFDGFKNVLPAGGDIVISQEASTYRPEMEWVVRQMNAQSTGHEWSVREGLMGGRAAG